MFGQTRDEIEITVRKMNLPGYTTDQICTWLYRKETTAFHDMTDIAKTVRQRLTEEFDFSLSDPIKTSRSSDGTQKYLFSVQSGKFVETVFIPEKTRGTLCLSTQIGCRWACKFCHTGQLGFHGNMTTGEILNQYRSLPDRKQVDHFVFMGMGEPLDNLDNVLKSLQVMCSEWGYGLSPSRVTVSTVGILPGLKRFLAECRCHLAVSLHSPFPNERSALMPVERLHPIREIVDTIRRFPIENQRRVSMEYVLLRDINDSRRHAAGLVELIRDLRSRINLIPYNPIPNVDLEPAPTDRILAFQNFLKSRGLTATIRKSRGWDVGAACGMLSPGRSRPRPPENASDRSR